MQHPHVQHEGLDHATLYQQPKGPKDLQDDFLVFPKIDPSQTSLNIPMAFNQASYLSSMFSGDVDLELMMVESMNLEELTTGKSRFSFGKNAHFC